MTQGTSVRSATKRCFWKSMREPGVIRVDLAPLLSSFSQLTGGSHLVNNMKAPATFCLFVCVTLGGAIPAPQSNATVTSPGATGNVQGQHEMVSSSHIVSAANGLVVTISEKQVNKECIAKFSIFGNGINKTTEYPCGKAPADIINLKDGLAIGTEWFTDKAGTLVHLVDNKCQKEVFTEKDGTISSTSETLSDDECQKVRTKISDLKKEQQKWDEWLAQQQQAMEQQFQQLQQNFQWFQNQLFGGI